MSAELYHWLEAISSRREYVEDRLSTATPVFCVSRPEGIYLLGLGLGHSKVFEIHDRHALAALGNPVDIEKLRQTAIEAAHVEAFNRSAEDVTLRRLVSFALSPMLKNTFETILEPPLIVESILAEVGRTPEQDVIVQLDFDGNFEFVADGVAIASPSLSTAVLAKSWLQDQLRLEAPSLPRISSLLLTLWDAMTHDHRIDASLQPLDAQAIDLDGKEVEMALLDRLTPERVKYRALTLSELDTVDQYPPEDS